MLPKCGFSLRLSVTFATLREINLKTYVAYHRRADSRRDAKAQRKNAKKKKQRNAQMYPRALIRFRISGRPQLIQLLQCLAAVDAFRGHGCGFGQTHGLAPDEKRRRRIRDHH
jgi:hypothetical protein